MKDIENKYLKDNTTEENYREYNDDSILNVKNAIAISALIAGSTVAYKKGIFKDSMHDILESVSKNKPTVSVFSNEMRNWINSDYLTPEKSVFRMGFKDTIKEFATLDLDVAKNVVDSTKRDWSLYLKRVDRTLDEIVASSNDVRHTLDNTDLITSLKFRNKALEKYSDSFFEGKESIKNIINENIIQNAIQTSEQAEKEITRNGFRSATIKDLFDIETDTTSNRVKLRGKKNLGLFNFKDEDYYTQTKSISNIENMLNSQVVSNSGVKVKSHGTTYRMHNKFQNFSDIVLDEHLMIDEAGKLIDLRKHKKNRDEFIRNLATEWKIPIININPLRLFGIDRVGRQKVKYASFGENEYVPAITKLRGNFGDKTIKDAKKFSNELKDVNEAITIIDGKGYTVNKKGVVPLNFNVDKELIYIPASQNKNSTYIRPSENSIRKMQGLSKVQREMKNSDELEGIKKTKNKIFEFLDLGNQESQSGSGAFNDAIDYVNPDNYFNNILTKLSPKRYKNEKRVTDFESILNPNNKNSRYVDDSFMLINKSITMKDVKDSKMNRKVVKNYFKQFYASMENNPDLVNRKTGVPYYLMERMNQGISSLGLGLSLDNTKSTWDTAKNLILKRFLPVYAGYEALSFIGSIGDEDDSKKPTSLQQKAVSTVMKTDIGFHKILDGLKVTKFVKDVSELAPGFDQIEELPIITAMNLHQTSEEREEQWTFGADPVRKGRYWTSGSFTGEKIDYFKPNAYRRAMSNYKFSDSMYGSKFNYINMKYNPFATGQFERMHYDDRPYLLKSAPMENVPLIGPALSSVTGKLHLNRKMHKEYWNGDKPLEYTEAYNMELNNESMQFNNYSMEKTNGFISNMFSKKNNIQLESMNLTNSDFISNISQRRIIEKQKIDEVREKDKTLVSKIFKLVKSSFTGYYDDRKNYYTPDYNDFRNMGSDYTSVYKTDSGKLSVVNLGQDNFAQYNINKKDGKLSDSFGSSENVNIEDGSPSNEEVQDYIYSNPEDPYSLSNTVSDQLVDTANVAGIYGFAATGFVTGNPGEGDTRIETSGYATSFNKTFQNEELGGFGGEISEIFRRFVQFRRKDVNYYNPIRNTMPDWMPGHGEFVDFTHGDPYSKIPSGEIRLPGEAYEKAYGINNPLRLGVGSSSIGKTKEQMVNHFLQKDMILDEENQGIVTGGTRTHEKIEKQWLKEGKAIDVEGEVKDTKHNIIGYYDALVHDDTSKTGDAIVDIKTISGDGFKEVKKRNIAKYEHQAQVNFYLHATDREDANGYIYYINRDNPEETHTIQFGYSKQMMKDSYRTLEAARNEIKKGLSNNTIQRGDLYKPIDRFRILADVAPYSDAFKQQNTIMTQLGNTLTKEEQKEVKIIRDRVQKQRDPLRTYEYRFIGAKMENKKTKLERQISPNQYLTEQGNTIKLAGVDIVNKDNEKYDEAMNFLKKNIGRGQSIHVKYSADELKKNNKDLTSSLNAVVYSNGMNINRELIKRGFAEEKKDDYSPAAVHARFNSIQRAFGRSWEKIAHQDTILNRKILDVKSATEEYEREQVYGKDFKSWTQPFSDFLKPYMWKNINRPSGIIFGGLIGYAFGGTKYGKLIGATVGAGSVAVGKIYKHAYKTVKDEKWIPAEVRERREIEDYVDKLKYIKNKRLYEEYSRKALKEDGIDVKTTIAKNEAIGRSNKSKKRKIKKLKVEQTKSGKLIKGDIEDAGIDISLKYKIPGSFNRALFDGASRKKIKDIFSDGKGNLLTNIKEFNEWENKHRKREVKKEINKEYSHQNRKTFNLSNNAKKAIQYKQAMDETMYSYDSGEPLQNFIKALPKKDRKYFNKLANAPEHERKKALEIAPKYMRKGLQSAYGMKVDKKENLEKYFSRHALPDEKWKGWDENIDLNSVRVKLVQKNKLNFGSSDIWQQDKVKADMSGKIPIPNIDYKQKVPSTANTLRRLLGKNGYEDVRAEYSYSTNKKSRYKIKIKEDRKEDVNKRVQEELSDIGQ